MAPASRDPRCRGRVGPWVVAPLLAAMVAGACARDPIELPSVTVCLPPTSAQRVAVGGAVSDVLASPDGCRVLYRDREATFHDVAIDGLDDRVIGKGMPPYFGARPAIGPRGQWVSLCGESCWLHRFGGETLAFDPPASRGVRLDSLRHCT